MRRACLAALSIVAMGVAGCNTVERDTAVGAGVGGLGGAAIGAGISGNAEGALIGGAIGAAGGAIAGNVIGRSRTEGECVYRDRSGRRYVAECPRDYY